MNFKTLLAFITSVSIASASLALADDHPPYLDPTQPVDVTNSGSRAGDEVVQFYGHEQKCRVKQPNQKLIAFERSI